MALPGRDELVGLTRSFADMTQQLADARAAVDASMRAVDASRANLQTILDNLTAGVIVLDAQGLIQSSNPGATRILRRRWRQRRPGCWAARTACRPSPPRWTASSASRASAGSMGWTRGRSPSSSTANAGERAAATDAADPHRAARHCPAGCACWCSTTSPKSSRPSAPMPGARWRGGWRTKSEPAHPIQLSAERLDKLADKPPGGRTLRCWCAPRTIVDQVDAMEAPGQRVPRLRPAAWPTFSPST